MNPDLFFEPLFIGSRRPPSHTRIDFQLCIILQQIHSMNTIFEVPRSVYSFTEATK